jgi:hypothetical protein
LFQTDAYNCFRVEEIFCYSSAVNILFERLILLIIISSNRRFPNNNYKKKGMPIKQVAMLTMQENICFHGPLPLKLSKVCRFMKFYDQTLINQKLQELGIGKVYIVYKVILSAFQIRINIQGVPFEKIIFMAFL